jgi:mannosyl-3-phosphoglycerate phosphatase
VPLVLATSKTAAEVADLHAQLGLGATPAIIENGAGLFDPMAPPGAKPDDYARIGAALTTLPTPLRAAFRGFGEMTRDEVARTTGLSPKNAALAKTRAFSEPGLWNGDVGQLAAFQAALAKHGITARHGGRFLTLSFGRSKADAMRELADRLGATTTFALGDAPNDIEMLQAADRGVIVRNDHGTPIPSLPGEASGTIRRSSVAGPAGWNEAVLKLLTEFGS